MGLELLIFKWRDLYFLSSDSSQRRTRKIKKTINELNPNFEPLGKSLHIIRTFYLNFHLNLRNKN
jgi:hypothetical protein